MFKKQACQTTLWKMKYAPWNIFILNNKLILNFIKNYNIIEQYLYFNLLISKNEYVYHKTYLLIL